MQFKLSNVAPVQSGQKHTCMMIVSSLDHSDFLSLSISLNEHTFSVQYIIPSYSLPVVHCFAYLRYATLLPGKW
jgi:hypothetical protein